MRSMTALGRPQAALALALLVLPASTLRAQESAAAFDSPLVVLDSSQRYERVVEMDGDGYPDAFSWWWKTPFAGYGHVVAQGHLNDGTGALVPTWTLEFDVPEVAPNQIANHSCAGDFDGDGLGDLALSFEDELHVLLARGASPALHLRLPALGADIEALAALDADVDGDDDIAVAGAGGVRLVSAIGPALIAGSTHALAQPVEWMVAGEATGDAFDDLILGQAHAMHVVEVLFGALAATPTALEHGVLGAMPAYGDVDGDGDGDLVLFGPLKYRLARRTSSSGFTLEELTSGGPATGLADVDGDGDLDGVCCSGGGGQITKYVNNSSSYEFALNDGSGQFAKAFPLRGLGSHHLAGAVDLDLDGDLDFVAGRCVLYGRGPLSEPPALGLVSNGVGGLLPVEPFAVHDVDDDGDPDFELRQTGYQRNLGDGRVYAAAPPMLGAGAGQHYAGPGVPADWDGDGDVDLLVVVRDASDFVAMRVLWNNGGGGFDSASEASAGLPMFYSSFQEGLPEHGRAADVDGDGDLDFVQLGLNGAYNHWQLWLNDGQGFFSPGASDNWELAVGVEQLDGLGAPDLLVVAAGWGSTGVLQVRLAQPDGSYAAGVPLPEDPRVDWRHHSWLAADLDADGDVDVVTTDGFRGEVRVHRNDGQGQFASELLAEAPVLLLQGSYPYDTHVVADDFDGDGQLDLLCGPSADPWQQDAVGQSDHDHHSSSWLVLRSPDGQSWLSPQRQIMEPLTSRDVDGDGDADAIGTYFWKNTRVHVPESGPRFQFGHAGAGSGGMEPNLGISGPFHIGSTATYHFRGAVGGAPAFLVFGDATTTLAGFPHASSTLFVDPAGSLFYVLPLASGGTPGVPGVGGFDLSWSIGAGWNGVRKYAQVFALDLGAPGFLSHSTGLRYDLGVK